VNKLWTLARKEVVVAFRDRGALISMLLTPLLLTVAIGAAFGGDSDRPISNVPVLLLNRDEGPLAAFIVEAFESEQLAGLVVPERVTDEEAARLRVDRGEAAALVVLPPDFTERLLPYNPLFAGADPQAEPLTPEQIEAIWQSIGTRGAESDPTLVEIYASPTRRIGTAVTQAIVSQVLDGMQVTISAVYASMAQLAQEPAMQADPMQLAVLGQALGASLLEGGQPTEARIMLEIDDGGYRPFRWVDYSAASMAVLFMMFAAMSGGRSLLYEREAGTLPRLLISPNRPTVLLVGKMAGVAATGVLQMAILWRASGLIGAYWGPTLPVVVAILVLVICATGLGALIAGWARTNSQAAALGTGITLAGGALSGSFFPRSNLPAWVRTLSLVTPNSWGIEIFGRFQSGQDLAAVAPYLAGALALALAYYVVAALGFRRQFSV
jgi:ABC-2 type transport system permease protein